MDEDEFEDLGEEEEEEEDELDPNNPDHAFIILERNFNRTIAEIEQNPEIALYADEFNRLFEALYDTNEKRKELLDKCADLEEQVEEDIDKINLSLKLAEADASTINQLKSKIEHAWKMADGAHDREQQAQEIIDNLRNQINALTQELDFKNKLANAEDDEDAEQANKAQEGMQRETDRLMTELGQLQRRLQNAVAYQHDLENKNSTANIKIKDIEGRLLKQTDQLMQVRKERDKLQGDARRLNIQKQKVSRKLAVLHRKVMKESKTKARLIRYIRAVRVRKKLTMCDFGKLSQKHTKLRGKFSTLRANQQKLIKKLKKTNLQSKVKDNEALKLKDEIDRFKKVRENYDKKIIFMEKDKAVVVLDRDKLRQMHANMEKDVENLKKQGETDKRTMEGLHREKDILNKNIIRHQAVVKDHIKLIKIQEQSRKKLEAEIDQYMGETGRQRKQISYLEKERDRLVDEQLDLTGKIEDIMDDIKLKKANIYDLKKNLVENDTKMRMQQNLFETVRADRNGLQKSLQESTAECSELKNKLKISNHQSEQLKEDISMKEHQLIREENILRKLTKEKENLRVDLDNALENIKALKGQIAEMTAEEKRLHKVITDGDRTIRDQAKDLEQLMNERDILGSQLVRRNDEIALLYEKIRILQSTLHRGEAHYERRLEDIRLLKIEVRRLRQEKFLLSRSITNMTDLRQEIFHLERDLTRERLKCRALEDEIQNPLNIHRWRKLEGSDPDVLELLRKVQLLQKRLLQQAADAIERERQLKEAEKLYVNLRQVLARQPGPDVQNVLIKTQRALTIRGNKMKCLVSELNMTEQQSLEYKEEVVKLRNELKDVRKKYLVVKKAHEKQLEAMKAGDHKPDIRGSSSDQIKFTGGGFRMSVTSGDNN